MKNKVINITILLLLVIFISIRLSIACEELNKSAVDQQTNNQVGDIELPAAFSATAVSSSDHQLHYSLILKDNRFKEVVLFDDESQSTIENTGLWEISNNRVTLTDHQGELLKLFRLQESELLLIKATDETTPHLTINEFSIQPVSEFSSIINHQHRLREDGVQFIASGNEPFWSVQIDNENNISFRTPDTDISGRIPNFETGSSLISTSFNAGSVSARLDASELYCVDSMSGFLFTHTVTLTMENETWFGCGAVL
ncbi:MAG: hypothetical protein JJU37_01795 [Balneolaceae bacterium]|nr:hypothetical protein [Balneolaceae bacterium]